MLINIIVCAKWLAEQLKNICCHNLMDMGQESNAEHEGEKKKQTFNTGGAIRKKYQSEKKQVIILSFCRSVLS